MQLYNFDERDVGEYAALIEATGERSAPARLDLAVAPQLQLQHHWALQAAGAAGEVKELTLEAGRELSLSVRLVGWPRPEFAGLLNGQPLRPPLASVQEGFDDDQVTVRISSLKR